MIFENVLKNAESTEITKEEALYLFKEANSIEKLTKLFEVASEVRDENKGRVFKFDGFIGSITPCTIDPPCKYCGRASKSRGSSFSAPLTFEEIQIGAKLIAETGVKRVELGGGTVLDGAGDRVIEAVNAVKSTAPMIDIWVNVGPSLSRDALVRLKELEVKEVCSSVETYNPTVFAEVKPGDSREARMKLAREINDVGLGLKSVMMVGIGSTYEDYVDYMFWLKDFKNLSHFPITGFRPGGPGTPLEDRKIALSVEVAKVGAVARLVLRKVDISFGGMMNDPQLLPLWIMAGANRAIHMGPHWHRQRNWSDQRHSSEIITETIGDMEFSNKLPLTTRIAKSMGMGVDVDGWNTSAQVERG